MSIQIQPEVQPPYSRWLTEEVYKLIDMVRSDEAIYNPRHKYYFCRSYVENFWRQVDLSLRKNSGASLSKWTNLRISFRREYTNYDEEKVPPCWTYFEKMFFLHTYLRNKKQSLSGPRDIESHLQEALAQLTNINYKPHHKPSDSPVNDFEDTYLSYIEDEPNGSPVVDDPPEEDENPASSLKNEIKSECEQEQEDKNNYQQNDELRDILVEIPDDGPPTMLLKRDSEIVNRSLLKRCRTEPGDSTSVLATTSNVSFVRPLAMVPISIDTNTLSHSVATSSSSAVGSTSLAVRMPVVAEPVSPVRRTDLCPCKTDSDAMFLMSLLPDIHKLHGRDRGKIKIAFQNILQEYLYPE